METPKMTCSDAGLATHLVARGFTLLNKSANGEFTFQHHPELFGEIPAYYQTHRPMLTRSLGRRETLIRTPEQLLSALAR